MSRIVPVCVAAALAAVVLPAVGQPPAQPVSSGNTEPLVDRVRMALDKGLDFLRRQERGRGHWENDIIGFARPGGTTALTMLALLNCGLKPDDPVVQRGLEYLRKFEAVNTYVVGLQ